LSELENAPIRAATEVAEFIRENLELLPVPAFPDIVLYTPHPASGLRRLESAVDEDGDPYPPYWAYVWGGGAVLVRHIRANPGLVQGRRVVDLGSGSGIVGIAAAQAGAASVLAAEVDRNGLAAIALNAAANGVDLASTGEDLIAGDPPDADLMLVGDLFYAPDLASRVLPFLTRCAAAGIEVVVGDPFRAHLSLGSLLPIAEYSVADFGDSPHSADTRSAVFQLRA